MRLSLAAFSIAVALPALAEGAALSLVPDDQSPDAGTTLTISVEIDASAVGCFSFSVEYDPAVLEYLGASEGILFTSSPELTFFSDDVDEQGRPQPNDCLLGFGTTVTGPGTAALLSFNVLNDAPTGVTLRDPVLRDVDRLPLPGVTDVTAWLNTSVTSTPGAFASGGLTASPNPSSSRMSLVLSGKAATTPGQLLIYDIAGRLVRELSWPAGTDRQDWDGRDREGRPVANGVYFARFDSGSRRAQTRIVRVR